MNSDMKVGKANSVLFFFSANWRLDALKGMEKIILENVYDQEKKKLG